MSGHVAAALSRIPGSQSIAATDHARELIRAGHDILLLTAGEPDFDTPDHVKAAAIAAIERGETKYPPVAGERVLLEAISAKFERENGLDVPPEHVIVSNGAKQVIFNAFVATLDPGDQVIVPAPFWVSYPAIAQFAGADVVELQTHATEGFKVDPEALERSITDRTRWLLLNSPHNPTGASYTRAELAALAEVLERHEHVLVLSDDIYEHLTYGDEGFTTLAAVAPGMADRVLTVNGVSKAYAMTGWRIGYAGGPGWLIKAMRKLQSQSTGGACSIAQHAAVAALTGDQSVLGERRLAFARRRDVICDGLQSIEGIEVNVPDGAFYVFPSCAGLLGKVTPTGKRLETDEDVATFLLTDAGVATVHGAAYGASPHVRLSFAASEATLVEGCERIRRACDALTD